MTAAAQRELFRQALAMPKKARLDLRKKLLESLEEQEVKVSRKHGVAETSAVYGKTARQVRKPVPKTEVLSKKEWNETWKTELDKRIEEIDSGKVKCIPYSEVRKKMDRILGRA